MSKHKRLKRMMLGTALGILKVTLVCGSAIALGLGGWVALMDTWREVGMFFVRLPLFAIGIAAVVMAVMEIHSHIWDLRYLAKCCREVEGEKPKAPPKITQQKH